MTRILCSSSIYLVFSAAIVLGLIGAVMNISLTRTATLSHPIHVAGGEEWVSINSACILLYERESRVPSTDIIAIYATGIYPGYSESGSYDAYIVIVYGEGGWLEINVSSQDYVTATSNGDQSSGPGWYVSIMWRTGTDAEWLYRKGFLEQDLQSINVSFIVTSDDFRVGVYNGNGDLVDYYHKAMNGALPVNITVFSTNNLYNNQPLTLCEYVAGEQPPYIGPLIKPCFEPVDTPTAGFPTTFNASSTIVVGGAISYFLWDMNGDGNTDINTTSPIIEWTYQETGSYEVTLTVVVTTGDSASTTRTVTVYPPGKMTVYDENNNVIETQEIPLRQETLQEIIDNASANPGLSYSVNLGMSPVILRGTYGLVNNGGSVTITGGLFIDNTTGPVIESRGGVTRLNLCIINASTRVDKSIFYVSGGGKIEYRGTIIIKSRRYFDLNIVDGENGSLATGLILYAESTNGGRIRLGNGIKTTLLWINSSLNNLGTEPLVFTLENTSMPLILPMILDSRGNARYELIDNVIYTGKLIPPNNTEEEIGLAGNISSLYISKAPTVITSSSSSVISTLYIEAKGSLTIHVPKPGGTITTLSIEPQNLPGVSIEEEDTQYIVFIDSPENMLSIQIIIKYEPTLKTTTTTTTETPRTTTTTPSPHEATETTTTTTTTSTTTATTTTTTTTSPLTTTTPPGTGDLLPVIALIAVVVAIGATLYLLLRKTTK